MFTKNVYSRTPAPSTNASILIDTAFKWKSSLIVATFGMANIYLKPQNLDEGLLYSDQASK